MFTKRKPLNNSMAAAKATCSEIDVVVADSKPDVCLAVFDSRLPIYTMLRTDASLPVWKSTVRRVPVHAPGSVER